MGVLDAIQKTCEPKKILGDRPRERDALTPATTQPGQASGSPVASGSPGPSVASVASGYHPTVPCRPCSSCGTPAAWESIYDGTLRCPECEPPPGRSFARRWWTIWMRPMETGDVIPPGFATARFLNAETGVRMVPEWIEMDAPRRF